MVNSIQNDFFSITVVEDETIKDKFYFLYPYQGTKSGTYQHLEPYNFLQTILELSQNQNAVYLFLFQNMTKGK